MYITLVGLLLNANPLSKLRENAPISQVDGLDGALTEKSILPYGLKIKK